MKKKLIAMQKADFNNKKPSATDVSKPQSTGFLTSCGLVTLPLIQYASGFMTMMLLESQKEHDHCLSTQRDSSRNHTQRGRGLWGPMNFPATNSTPACSEPCKDSCNELATIKVATYLPSFVVLIALVMHTINSISCNEKKQACKESVELEAQKSPDSSTPLNKSIQEEDGRSTLRYV